MIVCQICNQSKEEKYFDIPEFPIFFNNVCIDCENEIKNKIKEENEKKLKEQNAIIQDFSIGMSEKERVALSEYLEESFNDKFKITKSPVASMPTEEDLPFKVYVKQIVNGGMSGDEFAGQISIEFNNRFLTYNYSM